MTQQTLKLRQTDYQQMSWRCRCSMSLKYNLQSRICALLANHYFCNSNYQPLPEPPQHNRQPNNDCNNDACLHRLPLDPLSCLQTPRCLTPVELTHWRVQVSIYPWYVFVFVGGGARMERKPPVGIQTQRNMYLPSQYTSTGTLMTPALVYI